MPYKIKKSGSGYKVCKKKGGKCFSKKPLSKQKAKAQLSAIGLHTHESKKPSLQDLIEEVISDSL
ncbi:MAG: hypothetical protein EBU90_01100 [Proteobacteria bacterium]|nr:hypothetical protein [Pseudomonadota bacterium]NBP13016.1 hypothetical protein [bacterium]